MVFMGAEWVENKTLVIPPTLIASCFLLAKHLFYTSLLPPLSDSQAL